MRMGRDRRAEEWEEVKWQTRGQRRGSQEQSWERFRSGGLLVWDDTSAGPIRGNKTFLLLFLLFRQHDCTHHLGPRITAPWWNLTSLPCHRFGSDDRWVRRSSHTSLTSPDPLPEPDILISEPSARRSVILVQISQPIHKYNHTSSAAAASTSCQLHRSSNPN